MYIDIELREMVEEDLPQVLEIEQECFSSPWSLNTFLRELTDIQYSLYLTAYHEDSLIGYIGAWLVIDELHITNLAVTKDYRGCGIASCLLEQLMELACQEGMKYALLEVRKSNKAARSLYKKYGFYEFDQRRKYYQDTGEDAVIMRKEFVDEQK